MLNCKSLCFSILLLVMVLSHTSCSKMGQERYISDSDTSYSLDIRNISKKINASPANAELYYTRSNTFYFEDNFKQAIYDIDYALKLDSVNPLYLYSRGKYLMAGDTANAREAESSFKKAIVFKPDFIDAMSELAKLYLAKQNYTGSEDLYQRINKQDPSNPLSYFYLGIIAKEQGDTSKAIQLFEKTLVYDDKHYNAIMQLGNIYAVSQDKKAIVFYDRAIKVNEFSDEALYAKGLYLQRESQYKDAVSLYETVARMNPAHIFCRYNLGYINGVFGNYQKAIEYLDQAIDLAPEYAEAYTLRGNMKEQLKNSTGAYNDYKHALQLDESQVLAEQGLKRINITISMP
jgi:tetratricopeptide (TPR) repeat protein